MNLCDPQVHAVAVAHLRPSPVPEQFAELFDLQIRGRGKQIGEGLRISALPREFRARVLVTPICLEDRSKFAVARIWLAFGARSLLLLLFVFVFVTVSVFVYVYSYGDRLGYRRRRFSAQLFVRGLSASNAFQVRLMTPRPLCELTARIDSSVGPFDETGEHFLADRWPVGAHSAQLNQFLLVARKHSIVGLVLALNQIVIGPVSGVRKVLDSRAALPGIDVVRVPLLPFSWHGSPPSTRAGAWRRRRPDSSTSTRLSSWLSGPDDPG